MFVDVVVFDFVVDDILVLQFNSFIFEDVIQEKECMIGMGYYQ